MKKNIKYIRNNKTIFVIYKSKNILALFMLKDNQIDNNHNLIDS